ncbi:MAG: hypothetical protein L3K14_02015 [Thermoplasmata archaeon]|nr:hypothetical protein [Thermoplasmata archaeon]
MGFAGADLSAIPVQELASRRLHLGPFGSGRELAKFLMVATVGAAVAAVSSAVLWLPFLGLGVLVSFVRVEGRTLDDYALGYLRFRWRSSPTRGSPLSGVPPSLPPSARPRERTPSLQAGGIPIAYLPPEDLQRLFEEWRTTLTAVARPLSFRMRGEAFSPLPFLPPSTSSRPGERQALEAYRQLVHLLLRHRYRRVVELTVGGEPTDLAPRTAGLHSQVDALLAALRRMGIAAETLCADPSQTPPTGEASP